MTGFPKASADFSKSKIFFPLEKEWQSAIEGQARLYLKNQRFFSNKTGDWKYFPFQKLLRQNFVFDSGSDLKKKEPAPLLDGALVISVKNGKAFPLFSPDKDLLILSWRDFALSKADLGFKAKKKILSALKEKRNPFCSLSSALAEDGLILIIKNSLKQPLEIHYRHSSKNEGQGIHLRNFIFAESGAKAQITEVFYSREEPKPLFFNSQTDCFIGEGAELEHIRADQAGAKDILIHQLFAKLSKGAKAGFFSLSLGAGLSRWLSDLEQEEKSSSFVRGLSCLRDNLFSERQAFVSHKGREGESHQLDKSFLFDSARHVFQGRTFIEKAAQKTTASQLSSNFLFGKRASAIALPELDISADDVKAQHGATVSSLAENKDMFFYLQSRGIGFSKAFDMILSGLMEETLSPLQPLSKQALKSLLQKRLRFMKPKTLFQRAAR